MGNIYILGNRVGEFYAKNWYGLFYECGLELDKTETTFYSITLEWLF